LDSSGDLVVTRHDDIYAITHWRWFTLVGKLCEFSPLKINAIITAVEMLMNDTAHLHAYVSTAAAMLMI
jgi:hypothetical protein